MTRMEPKKLILLDDVTVNQALQVPNAMNVLKDIPETIVITALLDLQWTRMAFVMKEIATQLVPKIAQQMENVTALLDLKVYTVTNAAMATLGLNVINVMNILPWLMVNVMNASCLELSIFLEYSNTILMEPVNVCLNLRVYCAKIVSLVTMDHSVNTVMRQLTSHPTENVLLANAMPMEPDTGMNLAPVFATQVMGVIGVTIVGQALLVTIVKTVSKITSKTKWV